MWTVPVSPDVIAAARLGQWSVVLTPHKPVPREWFGPINGASVLCLASGGGQQGPVLAAAGAKVTVLDNSPAQLAQDQDVAERAGLKLALHLGEMTVKKSINSHPARRSACGCPSGNSLAARSFINGSAHC